MKKAYIISRVVGGLLLVGGLLVSAKPAYQLCNRDKYFPRVGEVIRLNNNVNGLEERFYKEVEDFSKKLNSNRESGDYSREEKWTDQVNLHAKQIKDARVRREQALQDKELVSQYNDFFQAQLDMVPGVGMMAAAFGLLGYGLAYRKAEIKEK